MLFSVVKMLCRVRVIVVLPTMHKEALLLDALLSLQSSVELTLQSQMPLVKRFAPEIAAIALAQNDPDAVLLTNLSRIALKPFQTHAQSKQTHRHQQLKAQFPFEAEDVSSKSLQVCVNVTPVTVSRSFCLMHHHQHGVTQS